MNSQTGEQSPWAYVLAAGLAGLPSIPVFWVTFLTTREPARLSEGAPKGFCPAAVVEDIKAVRAILSHDGKVFGVASFSRQLALGTNGFLLGWLLQAVGYFEKSKTQTPEAIEGLKAIMTFVPVVGLLLSAVIVWGYRLDRRTHAALVAETDNRGATSL